MAKKVVATGRRQYGYWREFANLEKELKTFIKTRGVAEGMMPSSTLLRIAGRADLYHAIHQHGGQHAVADRLGLRVRKSPAGYKLPLSELRSEVNQVAKIVDAPGYMPTEADFLQVGKPELLKAIHQWGGHHAVAKTLRLKTKRAHVHLPAAPRDEGWLKAELRDLAKELGLRGVMPSSRQLLGIGRRDLYNAIRGMGGFAEIAEVMGWRLPRTKVERK